jgi:hypothetical protein
MEVCRNSGRPHPIFLRRNKGKLLRHQFDVKHAFAHHQETMICQVTQGALDLGKFRPVYMFLVGCFVIGGGRRDICHSCEDQVKCSAFHSICRVG